MKICKRAFMALEVDMEGRASTCCPSFINYNFIGNIYNDDLSNIWHSEKAAEIRKSVLDGSYKFCNRDLCRQFLPAEEEDIKNLVLEPDYPKLITFAYDKECNLSCITCRDKKYKHSEQTLEFLNDRIENLFLPLLENAYKVCLSGSGEALYSRHGRLLIKRIVETYPDIKFLINSNGTMCTEKVFNSLGCGNFARKIEELHLSLPALSESVYNKIMIGSNLELVKNNIKWLAELHKKGDLKSLICHTVVSALNYKEIPKIYDFVCELGINLCLSQYQYWGTTFGKNYSEVAVWEKQHPLYEDFKKTLKSINTDTDKVFMQPIFYEIRNS